MVLLTKCGKFTVKSMYLDLKMGEVKWSHRIERLVRVSLKIKVFCSLHSIIVS
jgi:hypothetical protein